MAVEKVLIQAPQSQSQSHSQLLPLNTSEAVLQEFSSRIMREALIVPGINLNGLSVKIRSVKSHRELEQDAYSWFPAIVTDGACS